MSGHSKWASIKHKKGARDTQRGKIFTRHAKLIEIAAREGGGGDPDMNPQLLTAVENAKADNVPNANIERAIKKGTGELKGDSTEAVIYAAYAPGSAGIACIIECLTDNKNRTINNIRSAIERSGGKWAELGSVLFLFERKGVVIGRGTITDDTELAVIDEGAEDIEKSGDIVSVTSAAAKCGKVRDALRAHGVEIQEAGLKYVAKQTIRITDSAAAESLLGFIEMIEEDEDVSEVHTNGEME